MDEITEETKEEIKNEETVETTETKNPDANKTEKKSAGKKDTGKKFKFPDLRINWQKFLESLQFNWKTLLFTSLMTIVIMAVMFTAVFFLVVKSPEKVMVPNVEGKTLESALLDMQAKELYPKIQLRYSNSSEEKGTILDQNPPAGSIVKAGRRINLTVSRGIIVDSVGDYIGQKLDDVRFSLQTLFSGSPIPLIKIPEEPMYVADEAEPGTILEQDPLPGTPINQPVTMSFVVSRGSAVETTIVPWLVGKPLDEVLEYMSNYKVIYNFTEALAEENQEPGTVIEQKLPKEDPTPIYSVSDVTIAMPATRLNGKTYGIFTRNLPEYPYALKVQLDVIPPTGDAYTLITFKQTGKLLTIPYAVPTFSTLVLYVQDKEIARVTVQ